MQAPRTAATGEAYTKQQILSTANELVEVLEMPPAKQAAVLRKLERVLDDPAYRPSIYERVSREGVTGIIAYRLGEGGAVLTVKSGKAVVRRKGQAGIAEFKLSGADLGPQLAASREWGIGLVFGLEEPDELEGRYRGVQRTAAAGSGAGTATMHSTGDDHLIVFFGAGAGVSLDVSGSSLTLKPSS